MIIGVALAVGPLVISLKRPARHNDLFKRLRLDFDAILSGREECGFIDDKGRFLSRHEAYHHAVECGQIKAGGTECLVSEDVW